MQWAGKSHRLFRVAQPANILIVDDDRSVQRVLADALTKQGFVVTVERDGEWAVKTFEKKRFDAVLLDLLLPALNGYEVARQMKEHPHGRSTPIIMISGVYKNAIHQREAVHKHGAFAFLEKPIDLKQLNQVLKEALAERFPRPAPAVPPPPPIDDPDEATGEFMADDLQRAEVAAVEAQTKAPPKRAKSSELKRSKTSDLKRQKATPQAPAPAVTGDFATKPFAEVLADCYRSRVTGALRIWRQKVKKIIYLQDGSPELVKSNLLVECLGRVLVREKMISEAECDESLKRMKASKRMQGTVLIEMGCISPHNLNYALQMQMQDKLYDAFRWDSGEYQFTPNVASPPEPVSLGLTCAQLIHEGIKRSHDAKRLARVFANVDGLYVHPSSNPLYLLQDAQLGVEELEFLRMADGHKTVATLRALEVLSPLDTDRLLYAMKCAQMIELKPSIAHGRPRVSFAELAMAKDSSAQVPPPLPSMPPPLPKVIIAAEPPLELPWKDAPLAQPMAAPGHVPRPKPPPTPPSAPPTLPRLREPVVPQPLGSLLPELSEVMSLPRLSNEESVSRERLAGKVAAMRQLDYFGILGVKATASREDVKRAYFTLAREYHPDRQYHSASAELRSLAQQLYELIALAHDTLADPAERARYLESLKNGPPPPREEPEDVGKILAAEGKFQRGEELMRQRNYTEAHRLFLEAIAQYSEEGEFHAWAGWSLFQADPERAPEALKFIEEAIARNPKLDKSYLFLGYIHKANGRPDKAEKQFEKAIQSNPDCTEALRELRLLGRGRK
jgi:CheY-like chemotaxis protein/curved DNA-binding protein CbpA